MTYPLCVSVHRQDAHISMLCVHAFSSVPANESAILCSERCRTTAASSARREVTQTITACWNLSSTRQNAFSSPYRAAEQLRPDVQRQVQLEPVVPSGRAAHFAAVRVAARRPRRRRPLRHAVRPLRLLVFVVGIRVGFGPGPGHQGRKQARATGTRARANARASVGKSSRGWAQERRQGHHAIAPTAAFISTHNLTKQIRDSKTILH